ncbi:hypothetical protein M405DRAFT_869199 [Rhizopogon salebrosus TDB-379]|nr:hypothetical protein M405DRAFT_869199 [Rhizopogon salebrosus TDB-379]
MPRVFLTPAWTTIHLLNRCHHPSPPIDYALAGVLSGQDFFLLLALTPVWTTIHL